MGSKRIINGFVFNLAQQFENSCEHICYLIYTHQIPLFRADLLTGTIYPPELEISRNKKTGRDSTEKLPQ